MMFNACTNRDGRSLPFVQRRLDRNKHVISDCASWAGRREGVVKAYRLFFVGRLNAVCRPANREKFFRGTQRAEINRDPKIRSYDAIW